MPRHLGSPSGGRGGAVVIECHNCGHPVDPEYQHLGSQGWLCEPSPNALRQVALVKAALAARDVAGV